MKTLLKHKMLLLGFVIAMAYIGSSSLLHAQDTPPPAPSLPQDVANIIWLCLTAFLVFFMQAGFAMVESGLTRAKNSVNIMMKNLLDFCFGAVLFWATGYAIMYSSGDSNLFGFDSALALLGSANAPTDNAGYRNNTFRFS